MVSYLKKYWFFVGIAVVVMIAFVAPAVGVFVKTYNILTVVIFLGFLITGLTLETASIGEQFKNVRVLSAALISALVLFPAIAYFLAGMVFKTPPDWAIGALIIGVAPVTIASGTVMTAIALGNIPLSLFICVLTNLASILTIPFLLNLFLQFGDTPIVLPVVQMLTGLTIKVLVPTAIGQMLRPFLKNAIAPYKKAFSIFNQLIVLMIVLNAVSSSTARIVQAGTAIIAVFVFMIVLHVLILVLNFAISRFIRLDRASTSAFTIHTSQKTLTVSYIVWAGHFATLYPMALIPAIAYHITQSIMDTLVAHRFRERMEREHASVTAAGAPAKSI
ncbi:MAG: bile acid:sodium symporter [Desulfobacteraceae bacterium]|nr:bile acid:sodium symporter [Desulfobacteraceae bacterium]MBC2752152.1 bile acid:sodium symporter [Desulfobacteraceae bacterium]